MKKFLIGLLACTMALSSVVMTACGEKEESKTVLDIETRPASVDEIMPAKNVNSVEVSKNVNGMRFTLTLEQFTDRYNAIKEQNGEKDLISYKNWKENGEQKKDENGTKIQYYYYDEKNSNLTATVEVDTNKLLNVGCGTTINEFMKHEGEFDVSNETLEKASIMAEAACQFPNGSTDFLENVYTTVTTNKTGSVYYQGFVFSMDIKEDSLDSNKSIMLFRVFPITDELQSEWKLEEYGQ